MQKIKFIDQNLLGQPGFSPFIPPSINWQRDITEYDICIYTDSLCLTSTLDSSKTNYAWIIEPPIINGENYRDIVKVAHNFKKVFSHNLNLQNKIPNFVYIPHGSTWLSQDEIDLNIDKKDKLISFIFSDKQWNAFHRIRHRIYNEHKDNNIFNIDFFGTGCSRRIEKKATALSNYYFSIVVENSEEDDYFTEKLIDCILTGVIPIYKGTKNISKYFNIDSIIQFNDPEDLPAILEKLNKEFYLSKLDSVKTNFELAKKYINPEHLINDIIINE